MTDYTDNFKRYCDEATQNLSKYVTDNRDHDVERLATVTLFLVAYYTEIIADNPLKNSNDKSKLATYVILARDNIRALVRCQEEVSLFGLSLLHRAAFEIHCNLLYMFKCENPDLMIDRNFRFGEIEKLKYSKDLLTPVNLTQEEILKIKAVCPEWLDEKGNVDNSKLHWTAERGNNLRKIATSLGLEEKYLTIYSTHSKFVHGSYLAKNLYIHSGTIHFNGNPDICAQVTLAACSIWFETIREYLKHFGLDYTFSDYEQYTYELHELTMKYFNKGKGPQAT